ncbi:unnamed protein product [Clonostachys rosea]|uniref:D-3-phosphoglycerate dehydrogenase n=1 Tax=Bionectria ochroleuca TaxID=29856 RepID=A0ABY6UHV2_BIOOC|nr:unnamed protein product [Clonostachys rosea]
MAVSKLSKPTVYLLDSFHPSAESFCRENFNAIFPGEPEHANWRQNAQYILVKGSWVTADDIDVSPNLRAIGKQGVSIDKIDSSACARRGIKILNTPGANSGTVAELVLALAMGVTRQTSSIASRQAQGYAVPKETCSGQTLHGKSIGIVGMGHIGKAVARIFRGAFNSPVIAYDPFLPVDAWQDIPHTRASTIDDLLRDSDIITLHVPLTSDNKDMVSLPQFKLMKKNAILLNADRDGIVNEADLEVAMSEKMIWGAALDAPEEEPPTKEIYGRLWELGVMSTPHIGSATSATQAITGLTAAKRLLEFAQNHNPLGA